MRMTVINATDRDNKEINLTLNLVIFIPDCASVK